MSENGRYDTALIQTTDEDGQIHIFEKIDEFEVDDQEYALLIYKGTDEEPVEAAEDQDEEVLVMKVLIEDGEEVFSEIESEEEYQKVIQYLEESEDEGGDYSLQLGELLASLEKGEGEDEESDEEK